MIARSFPWRHIALRLAWNIAWALLAAWTPPAFHPWRRRLLILFGARIAPGARVYGSARIWYPPNLEMGRGAVLGWRSFAYSQDRILIGEGAIVSQWARLIAGSHDVDDPAFPLVTAPIRIGRRAWVAAGAVVGPGVTIAEGAVLGGAAVAFRDLEAWTIYAGNPARPIRARRRGDGEDGMAAGAP